MNEADWISCIHVLIDTPTDAQKAGPEVLHYGSFAGSFPAGCVHPMLWEPILQSRVLLTRGRREGLWFLEPSLSFTLGWDQLWQIALCKCCCGVAAPLPSYGICCIATFPLGWEQMFSHHLHQQKEKKKNFIELLCHDFFYSWMSFLHLGHPAISQSLLLLTFEYLHNMLAVSISIHSKVLL